jgi:M6 family metalloprotease-like protein
MRIQFKSAVIASVFFVLITNVIYSANAAEPKAGAKCSPLGSIKISKDLQYTCIKSGKQNVWDKGAKIVKATPSNSAAASVANLSDVTKCKLKIATNRGDVAVGGFPRYPVRMKSTGTVNTKVIMVDFPDAPASKTPQQAFAMISKADQIFNEVSYGKLIYKFDPVYKWYRMSKTSKSYAPLTKSFDNHQAYISEAIKLADPDVDFKGTDSFIILANPDADGLGMAGPAFSPNSEYWGIKVDGIVLTNGATSAFDLNNWGYIWLNHEITHTLGMVDLYSFEGNTSDYWSVHRFVGQFSYMGYSSLDSNAPGLLAWERWLLSWLDDNQIICAESGTNEQKITPIENAGGIKAVIIPISSQKVVAIESRRPIGIDKNLSKSGALVYTVESKIESGFGPIKVFPAAESDLKKLKSPIGVGEKVVVDGYTISVKSSDASGDVISVVKN